MSLVPRPEDILRFLAESCGDGVLVTLVAVEGSASRAVGAQMGVARDGSYRGSFSGGCIEAAVVAEALEVLAEGRGRTVRFGAGSPYLDVRLPCGGGIDLMFTPRPAPAVLRGALAALTARVPFAMAISPEGIAEGPVSAGSDIFVRTYAPPLRAIAVGQGDDLAAFVRLAAGFGTQVVAIAPSEQIAALGPIAGATVFPTPSREVLPAVQSDEWTAILFLFHDRDWEEFLLPQALALDGFYHGAIGNPRTQTARLQALCDAGVCDEHVARLRPFVGLIPSTRDPATLALSLLAHIVADYQALASRAECGGPGA